MIQRWLKIALVIIFIFSRDAFPQKMISIQLKSEYNFFSLTDLKNLQAGTLNEIQKSVPQASSLESYPAYYGFQLRAGIPGLFAPANNLDLGILLDYSSTGGRIHCKDYSGEIKFDRVLKFYSVGFFFQKEYTISSLFSTYFGVSTQAIITDLQFSSLILIGNTRISEEQKYESTSAGLEPNIGVTLNKYGFYLGFNLGYLAAVPVKITLRRDNKNEFLPRNESGTVSLDINGFRPGLTVGYSF